MAESYNQAIPEKVYQLTAAELTEYTKIAADIASNKAIEAYKKERIRHEQELGRKNDKVRRTKAMLSSYRRMKAVLHDDDEFTTAEKIEMRWRFIKDLMESPDRDTALESSVADNERRRQENLYAIRRIENAVELYREECLATGSEEALRRYNELYLMYLDEKHYTAQDIADKFNISDKAVYKDLGISYKILAAYLFGV